jgi:hypothetical protein
MATYTYTLYLYNDLNTHLLNMLLRYKATLAHEGQSKMDNPETLATQSTKQKQQRQIKSKQTKQAKESTQTNK